MHNLKVTTIFYSIQGEASHTGMASIFIRLHGCNLDCSFCDDLLHKENYTNYNYEEILDEIKQYESNNIIITGGEPSIYNLNNFIELLQANKYYVAIETNGFNFENIKSASWITYSPKDWSNIDLDYCDEFKFIVNSTIDMSSILNIKTLKPLFIQPENYFDTPNMDNIKYCTKLVQKYPRFKLSVQIHKFLNIK